MIDAARADGVDVTLDTYPYLAGSTYLHAFLPSWVARGRLRRDDRAAPRPGPPRAAAGRDGGRGVGRLPRDPDGLVGRRDRRRSAAREPALDRPQRGRCGGGGGGPPDRLPLRAPRGRGARRVVRCPHRQRGERAHDHDPPGAHGRERRDPRRRPAASTLVRDVPPLPRRLRPGARRAHVGAGDPQDDVAAGAAARRRRPGPPAAGDGRGRRLLRPRRGAATPRRTRSRGACPRGSRTCSCNGRFTVDDGKRTEELPGRALRMRSRPGSSRARPAA